MRKSPVYYINPSDISIIPNANGKVSDIAVTIADGTKIRVYSPMAGISSVKEWTITGRNRYLSEPVPYTIYARLSLSDDTAYLVFTSMTLAYDGEYMSHWTQKYSWITTDGLYTFGKGTDVEEQRTRAGYIFVRLGDVSIPDANNQRIVTLDTGILGTEEYNNTWALNPDALPMRINLECTIDGDIVDLNPYVHWEQSLHIRATIVEGWTGTDRKRFDHWEIVRNNNGAEGGAWPDAARQRAFSSSGEIELLHTRTDDDFQGAVATTFTIKAMEKNPEYAADSTNVEPFVVLRDISITVYSETIERYDLQLSDNIVSYSSVKGFTPKNGIVVTVKATSQRGDVYDLTVRQAKEARLSVKYLSGDTVLGEVVFAGEDIETASGIIPIGVFAEERSIVVCLIRKDESGKDIELSRRTVAFVRDGEDSKEREWIYTQRTRRTVFAGDTGPDALPSLVTVGEVSPQEVAQAVTPYDNSLDEWVPAGWTDDPKGVDGEYIYEYGAYRDYIREEGHWGSFSTPTIWVHDGADAVVYEIVLSSGVINADADGKVTSDGIIVTAYQTVGKVRSENILPKGEYPQEGDYYLAEYSVDGGAWTRCDRFFYPVGPSDDLEWVERYGVAAAVVKTVKESLSVRLKHSSDNIVLAETSQIKVVRDGQNAVFYEIVPDVNAISASSDGTVKTGGIEVSAYRTVGTLRERLDLGNNSGEEDGSVSSYYYTEYRVDGRAWKLCQYWERPVEEGVTEMVYGVPSADVKETVHGIAFRLKHSSDIAVLAETSQIKVVRDGQNAVLYEIVSDVNVISASSDGTVKTDGIEIAAYRTVGVERERIALGDSLEEGEEPSPYFVEYKIDAKDWMKCQYWERPVGDGVTEMVYGVPANAVKTISTSVKFRLRSSDSTTVLTETPPINVVRDGSIGKTGRTGRFYYYAGVYDKNVVYRIEKTQAPYVKRHTIVDGVAGEYFFMLDNNGQEPEYLPWPSDGHPAAPRGNYEEVYKYGIPDSVVKARAAGDNITFRLKHSTRPYTVLAVAAPVKFMRRDAADNSEFYEIVPDIINGTDERDGMTVATFSVVLSGYHTIGGVRESLNLSNEHETDEAGGVLPYYYAEYSVDEGSWEKCPSWYNGEQELYGIPSSIVRTSSRYIALRLIYRGYEDPESVAEEMDIADTTLVAEGPSVGVVKETDGGEHAVTFEINPSIKVVIVSDTGEIDADGIVVTAHLNENGVSSTNILPESSYPSTGDYYMAEYSINGIDWRPCGAFLYEIVPVETDDDPWTRMSSEQQYYIAKAFFGENAYLGSFIINGDWMLSQYGSYMPDANTTIKINASNAADYPSAYIHFKAEDPEGTGILPDGTPSYPCFAPNYAVDGLTGETYQLLAHVRGVIHATDGEFSGTVKAKSGTVGGFDIGLDRLYNSNWSAGVDISYDSKNVRIGKNAKGVMASEDAIIRAENSKDKPKDSDTYNTAMYLNATGAKYNYAFYGNGNGVLNGLVFGYKTQFVTIPNGSGDAQGNIYLKDGATIFLVGTHYDGNVTMMLPTLQDVKSCLGLSGADGTPFSVEINLLNRTNYDHLYVGFNWSGGAQNTLYPIRKSFDNTDFTGTDSYIQLARGDFMKIMLSYVDRYYYGYLLVYNN